MEPEDVGRMMAHREYRLQGAESLAAQANGILRSMVSCPELQSPEAPEGIRCYAGRSQFWIAWNGEMTPCGMLDGPKAAPLTEGFQAAWERLRGETAKIRLCSDCLTCQDRDTCFNCAAVLYTENGSFADRPEYMCRLNRAYREEILSLAKTLEK